MESIYLNNEIVNMKSYYDNGKLLNETPWKNGKMDGLKPSIKMEQYEKSCITQKIKWKALSKLI